MKKQVLLAALLLLAGCQSVTVYSTSPAAATLLLTATYPFVIGCKVPYKDAEAIIVNGRTMVRSIKDCRVQEEIR